MFVFFLYYATNQPLKCQKSPSVVGKQACGADAAAERQSYYPGATASQSCIRQRPCIQIPPEMCRFNPLFQFSDFYNKAPRHVFIYWFILFVKHSRCIRHHSRCIWKPKSPADLLNVTELNLFPVFFFFSVLLSFCLCDPEKFRQTFFYSVFFCFPGRS